MQINLKGLSSEQKQNMVGFLASAFRGTFWAADVDKRGTGEERHFRGVRENVQKHLSGGERRYDAQAYGLIPVWEGAIARKVGPANAYRHVAKEGVKRMAIGGLRVEF